MKIESASPVLPGYPVPESTLGQVPGFDPMTVVRWDEEGTYLSRLVLDEEARRRVAETGELYVFHGAYWGRFLPIRVEAERPDFTLPALRVLRLTMPGATPALCHGLEVTEAGGSERDREDYVVVEACELLLARAALPARAALLRSDLPWMDAGGETCPSREQFSEALLKRLRMALDLGGGKRVEVRDAGGAAFTVTVEERLPGECAGESVAAA